MSNISFSISAKEEFAQVDFHISYEAWRKAILTLVSLMHHFDFFVLVSLFCSSVFILDFKYAFTCTFDRL